MLQRILRSSRQLPLVTRSLPGKRSGSRFTTITCTQNPFCRISRTLPEARIAQRSSFHTTTACCAQSPTADALMEKLTDLYSTAKDEFEIAAEETEKKTVYAQDDRDAAKEALGVLKEAYERALKESDPEVAREVQTRTGPRIKELENALMAVEEMAMED